MTKQDIVDAVKKLNLPEGSYVIFGSCPLAAAGIREANDIDMLVSDETLNDLRRAGWQQLKKGEDDKPYVSGAFEAHANWDFSPYSPTLEQLLETATVIEGIPFASLLEVRKWKLASGEARHLRDVALIDEYLATH